MRNILVATVMMLGATGAHAQDRVLAVGGTVTEIIYALGEQDRLIGRDTTSSYPPEAEALPDVGYLRALSPEGILSVDPDLIIAEDDSGPPETIDVMQAAGIPFIKIPGGQDVAAVHAKIIAVAEALNVPEAGAALAADVDAQFAALQISHDVPKRVLFILSMQGGRILAAGSNTSAEGIITLAGGVNAITQFEGYKPVTDEAISALAPDVILMMDRGGDHAASDAELWATPSIATSPAAATQSVVRIDGLLLLGFGPRTPQVVAALNAALYAQVGHGE